MFKHGLIYLLSRLAPALASFFVLAAYTRYMSEDSYGRYSTLLALASSTNNFMFGWLYVGIMRFWQQQHIEAHEVQRLIVYVASLTGMLVLTLSMVWGALSSQWSVSLLFAGFFSALAFYEAAQRIHSMTLQVQRYTWTEVTRTIITTLLGIGLVFLGWQWQGAMLALIIGIVLVLFLSQAIPRYFIINPFPLNKSLLNQLLQYGVPLSISLVLLEMIHVSDRLLLTWFIGYGAAGKYSVAFNIPHQIIMMLTSTANLAAYPWVIRALEKDGIGAAQVQLKTYSIVLFGVSIPAMLGLLNISADFVPILVGSDYVSTTLLLMPWVGVAVLANCIYLFYVSLAFQLASRTQSVLKVVVLAALINIVLNFILIPRFGLLGSAWASIVAYGICLIYGLWVSRAYFVLPLMWLEWGKVIIAALFMYIFMLFIPMTAGIERGVVKIVFGIITYALAVLLLDIGGVRALLRSWWRTRRQVSL